MIALWMLAAVIIATLVAFGALAAERVARAWGTPSRDVWSAALALGVVLPPAALALPRTIAPIATAPNAPIGTQRLATMVVQAGRAPIVSLERVGIVAIAAWVVLSLLVLAVVARGAVTLARARRAWTPREVDGAPVLVAPDVGPAVVGLRRPAIVLPEWALALEAPLRALVVRHESEHVRAGDPRHLALGAVGVALMPWNPALWWMLRRQRTALEIDCDARVLAAHRDVSRYGLLLLAVAQRRANSLGTLVGAPALTESTSELSRRIAAMRRPQPRRRALRTIAGALGMSVAIVAAVVACNASRDLVAPIRKETSGVRQLGSGSVPAMLPSRDGVTMRTGSVTAERYSALRSDYVREVGSEGKAVPMMRPDPNAPYFEFQVEKPVTPAEGNHGPRYPELLKQANVEGVVLAQFVVNADGTVMPGSFKVLKSDHDLFTKAVASALYEMRFNPARVSGRAVKQLVQQPFQFELTK